MSEVGDMGARVDLAAIEAKWLQQCGPCDGGLSMGCTCPGDDPRSVIAALVTELERVEALTWFPAIRDAVSGEVRPRRRKTHVRVRDLDNAEQRYPPAQPTQPGTTP